MSNHPNPIQDTGGNYSFTSNSNLITDKSLYYVYWNDISSKPSFCNICFSANFNDITNKPNLNVYSTSSNLYYSSNSFNTSFSNLDYKTSNNLIDFSKSKLDNLKSSLWTTDVNLNIYSNLGSIGIGSSSFGTDKLVIGGLTNADDYKSKGTTFSNLFINSNNLNNSSNNLYKSVSNLDYNSSFNQTVSSQFTTDANNNIYIIPSSNFTNNPYSNTITSTCNSLVLSNNSLLTFNYTNQSNINAGTYNFVFSNGSISINSTPSIINKSYPILKDGSGNNINPTLWYKFDNNTDLGLDSSGNGYHLTNNSSVLAVTGVKGEYASSFDTTNYLSRSSGITFTGNNFSISYWQFARANGNGFSASFGNVWTGNGIVMVGYGINSANTYFFGFWNNDYYSPLYTDDLNKWIFVTYTYNVSSRTRKFYRNGVFVSSDTASSQLSQSGTPIGIGTLYGAGYATNGSCDDFRVYNGIELTQTQITELYNGRVSILSSNINLIYSNVGIGTSSSLSNDYLTIGGDMNINELKIKQTNISNFLITSNVFDQRSNQIIDTTNSNATYYGSSAWTTNYPSSSIFFNLEGNVGIGSANPKEKLDINGNLNINGNILPNSCNSFDLGSSNFRWKDIYLSGNSIYLDDLIISNSNNYLSVSKQLNVNQITLYNNQKSKTISLDTDGNFISGNKYLLSIDNNKDNSNIVLSNVLSNSSNSIFNFNKSKFNSLNTDIIKNGTSNKFITNDTYSNAFFSSTIQAFNISTSNLRVIGDTTTFNTTIYQTEQLLIENSCNTPAFIVKQMNINQNVAEFYSSNIISVGISGTGNSINIPIDNSNYRYAIFTSNGTFTINKNLTCDILIVGGGGGGGTDSAGGGGGGQVLYYTDNIVSFKSGGSINLSIGTYNINIGSGGAGGTGNVGSAGNSSTINLNNVNILSAGGGGGGGSAHVPKPPNAIGGGGGGSGGFTTDKTGASSTGGGGTGGTSTGENGGGGGGGANISSASKNGTNATSSSTGSGGSGVNINITGNIIGVGGGGSGGSYVPGKTVGTATHGGGIGYSGYSSATSGTANTGGGGGGAGYSGYGAGSGGSGVIIIRYLNNNNQLGFIINSNGNIGISSAIPSVKLDINGNTNSIGLIVNNNEINSQIKSYDSNYSNSIFQNFSTIFSNSLIQYSSNSFLNINNSKQDLLNSSTILLGSGGSLTNINYNNIINKPDLSIYTTSVNSTSNNLYQDLSNLDLSSSNSGISYVNTSIDGLTKFLWITNGNNVYTNSNIGIGTTVPTEKLDINGNISTNELLIKKSNISNLFITSNVFDFRSNNYYTSFSNQDIKSSNTNINYVNNIVDTAINNYIASLNVKDVWNSNNGNIYTNSNISLLDYSSNLTNLNANITTSIGAGSLINSITSTCNSLVLSQTSIARINYTNETIYNSGTYNIGFNNGAIAIGESPYVRPWGAYFADDWSGTTLLDSSGNGRHATTGGTITKTTASGNGASGAITYISGGTSANISFPDGSIPSNFTILGLTRYNGGTRQRILQSRNGGNWLLGHHVDSVTKPGVAFFEGWKTGNGIGILDNWLCIIGKNDSRTTNFSNNILVDGVPVATATGGTGNYHLGINTGSGEYSDWCLSAVIIYDSHLTDAHMSNLNNFINTYKTDGNITKLKANILRNIDKSYPILKDGSSNTINPIIWYKFDDSNNLGKDEMNAYNLTNNNCLYNFSNFSKGVGSISFNGSTSYLSSSSLSTNFSQANFSISYFQYALSTTNGSTGQIADQAIYKGYWFGYGINNPSQYGFGTWGNDMYSSSYNDTNIWIHVCFTYNSSTQSRKIYRNGILIQSGTLTPSTITIGNFYIGTLTTNSYMMYGIIDDFRIYQQELTSNQILELYNGRVDIYSQITTSNYSSNLVVRGDMNITGNLKINNVPIRFSRFNNQDIYNGFQNYYTINNRPYLLDLLTSSNIINVGNRNNLNFPLSLTSWKNEWFLFIGTSPTNAPNSFIFHHITSTINSKWWFNGTTTATNAEISDIRVKKDINDLSNGLDKLMLLKPKEYFLCDEKDYLKKYGIIAQDVYQTPELNHLVYKDTDFIANIYSSATYSNSNGIFILTSIKNINQLININDELKILLDNHQKDYQEIIIEELPYHNRYKKRFVKVKRIIDDYSFEIFNDIELTDEEKSNIFIYGKKINDFLKLDYSSLYTLNIKANQEIYNIIQNTYQTLDNLTSRVKNLENKFL